MLRLSTSVFRLISSVIRKVPDRATRGKTVGWRSSPRKLMALSCLERGERRINARNTISQASQSAVKICSRNDEAARLVETHLHAPYF
jgi:alpha-D-ribose 1-methylphosphonate 5-triphosphate synthase subunit PhnI